MVNLCDNWPQVKLPQALYLRSRLRWRGGARISSHHPLAPRFANRQQFPPRRSSSWPRDLNPRLWFSSRPQARQGHVFRLRVGFFGLVPFRWMWRWHVCCFWPECSRRRVESRIWRDDRELEMYQITYREQSEAAESLAVLDFFSDEHFCEISCTHFPQQVLVKKMMDLLYPKQMV